MADKKITALTESTSLSTDDLFHVVDSPSSSPSNKKITANNVFQKVPSWIGWSGTGVQAVNSGTTSTLTVTGGIIELTSAGTGDTVATANGTAGQLAVYVYKAQGAAPDTIIDTPATKTGFATCTYTDLGDTAVMYYVNDTLGWMCLSATSGSSESAMLG